MNLITNRTPQDVERWKFLRNKGWANMTDDERREWLGEISPTPTATKGMYTYRDMNRVESAVVVLVKRLKALGYISLDLDTKTDWSNEMEVTKDEMVRYFGNVKTLKNSVVTYSSTPTPPNVGVKLDYSRANDIEKILADIDDITTKIPQSWCYTGEIFSGEV